MKKCIRNILNVMCMYSCMKYIHIQIYVQVRQRVDSLRRCV